MSSRKGSIIPINGSIGGIIMLISNLKAIGDNLYAVRKTKGYTQADVAELSDLSDRTYADIERGTTAMRVDTLLKICSALGITPDNILVSEDEKEPLQEEILKDLNNCQSAQKTTALKLLKVYLGSVNGSR